MRIYWDVNVRHPQEKYPEKNDRGTAHDHHGKMEYGAVKSPATREAYALHILDELDSKLWVYEDVMKNTEPGTFSQPNRWLDGAVVYNSDVDLNSH